MKKILFLLFSSLLSLAVFSSCSDDDDNNNNNAGTEVKNQISITHDGKEIKNGDVIAYQAVEDELFGDIVAGHENDPSFDAKKPCKIDVTLTVPSCDMKYFQWCGITQQCSNYEAGGTYTRSKADMTHETMALHAYFKPGVFADCKVKVEVKVNDVTERNFYLHYIYSEKK